MGRFLEPSTWAGIAGMFSPLAALLPGTFGLVAAVVAGAAGGVAVALRERAK
jgi:hypothetical protein